MQAQSTYGSDQSVALRARSALTHRDSDAQIYSVKGSRVITFLLLSFLLPRYGRQKKNHREIRKPLAG